MLLARLIEYEKRMAAADLAEDTVPAGYRRRQVMGLIDLDNSGKLLSLVPLASREGRRRVGKGMAVPDRLRTKNADLKPLLLADTAEFVLGVLPGDPGKQGRTEGRHRRFVALVRECAVKTSESDVSLVLRFLESRSWEGQSLPEGFGAGDLVTFRVGDQYPIELPSVHRFWTNYLVETRATASGQRKRARSLEKAGGSQNGGEVRRQCLACGGHDKPIARLHEARIKGIPGGQLSGTALVSFNAPAFESHGLEQSYNAPVCNECAELYAKGLNRLISGEDTSLVIRPIIYVFWSREPTTFSPARLIGRDPEPQDVKALYEAAQRGRQPAGVSPNAFYAMGLSASGGRAVVRDWLETTVEEAQCNVARYFRLQHMVPSFGQEPRDFPIYSLARSLIPYRPGRQQEEPPSHVVVVLLRLALMGGQMPDWILYQAVKRNRAEQDVSWQRAALIKLALQSQEPFVHPNEEGTMDTKTQESPAYLCGRLLAILERAQQAAVNPRATLVDRFYGAASSAPASVFGNLLRNAQNHLGDLRKNKPGVHHGLQSDLEEVLSKLGDFPRTLNMRDQAVFALGYYYQRAQRWIGRELEGDVPSERDAK